VGLISQSLGTRIYLDTNIIIYVVEGYDEYGHILLSLLDEMDSGAVTAVTSELTRAEVLVKPKQDHNNVLEHAYKTFLQARSMLEIVAISENILEIAAELRAETKLKLPDAIHIATAIVSDCNVLLTNDRTMLSPAPCKVVLLSELG